MKKVLLFIVIISALIFIGSYLYRSHTEVRVSNNPASTQGDQSLLDQTVNALSKFIVLPTDDSPVLATVSDPAELAGEAFFKNAQVGDRVLVYPKAKKAILYRPSINKIIEMESIPDVQASSTVVQ